MKETTSRKVTETYDDYKKKPALSQNNHVFTKRLYYGRKIQKNDQFGQMLGHHATFS